MTCTLPVVLLMERKELELLKLLLFPLAIRCLVDKSLEIGLLPNWGSMGIVLSYLFWNTFSGYNNAFEKFSNSPTMERLISSYAKYTNPENRMFSNLKAVNRIRMS